jgi:hypothetical protein
LRFGAAAGKLGAFIGTYALTTLHPVIGLGRTSGIAAAVCLTGALVTAALLPESGVAASRSSPSPGRDFLLPQLPRPHQRKRGWGPVPFPGPYGAVGWNVDIHRPSSARGDPARFGRVSPCDGHGRPTRSAVPVHRGRHGVARGRLARADAA